MAFLQFQFKVANTNNVLHKVNNSIPMWLDQFKKLSYGS